MDCENCYYYDYDEEFDENVCLMELDEDEFARIVSQANGKCPFFRKGDDYYLATKQ